MCISFYVNSLNLLVVIMSGGNLNGSGEVVRVVESNSIEILGQKLSYPTSWHGVLAIGIVGATIVFSLKVLDADRIDAYARSYQEGKIVSDGVKVANGQQSQIELLTQLLIAKQDVDVSGEHIETLKRELLEAKTRTDLLKKSLAEEFDLASSERTWAFGSGSKPATLRGVEPLFFTSDSKLEEYLQGEGEGLIPTPDHHGSNIGKGFVSGSDDVDGDRPSTPGIPDVNEGEPSQISP